MDQDVDRARGSWVLWAWGCGRFRVMAEEEASGVQDTSGVASSGGRGGCASVVVNQNSQSARFLSVPQIQGFSSGVFDGVVFDAAPRDVDGDVVMEDAF